MLMNKISKLSFYCAVKTFNKTQDFLRVNDVLITILSVATKLFRPR